MTEKLKTGDIVLYQGKQYNVKLNGSVVYMRSNEPQFTLKRGAAELLPRVAHADAPPVLQTLNVKARKSLASEVARTRPDPEDKTEKLRALLLKERAAVAPDAQIDALVHQICDIFVSKNNLGGVYLIRIDEVAGKPIKFFVDGKESNEFVMVKTGKADSYALRFSQFSFQYTEVLRIDGDTTMEAELKRLIPCNWKPYFYHDSMRKASVLKMIGIPGNNAPTEWRIMSRKTFDLIAGKAKTINSINWQRELTFTDPVQFDERRFEIEIGSDKRRANYKILEIL